MKQRFLVLLFALTVWRTTLSHGADRYVAWLADGAKLAAPTLGAWPLPGAASKFAEHDLAAANNPVRLLRDRQLTASLAPPYVVMANGDVVGGTLVQLEPDLGRIGQTPRVRLQLESPLMPVMGTGIAVRTDRVRRIVVAPESVTAPPPPGTVILADGRRLTARAIRWRDQGLAVLTAEGVVEAGFGDLAEVVFPNVDRAAAVLSDNLWASGTSGTAIARFQTTSGGVITAARVSREQEQSRRRGRLTSADVYYVQPSWADQPLVIPEQEIVCCGYRAADEAPLTLFGSELVANRRLIGQAALPTAELNVAGGLFAAANRESDLGIAVHAHNEVAFELPSAARTLELAVGLDKSVGEGGCVRCKVMGSELLWDSGVIQGKDGAKARGQIDVAGLKRVVLVTEMAHEERPPGADPLDIRDAVVWLLPLVKLDLSDVERNRALAVLPGAGEWQLVGEPWNGLEIASRWNLPASSWDPVATIAKGVELQLARKLRVTRAGDIVELLTVCPADLDEHDFMLKVNGAAVGWHNNADRNQIRQWTLRYSRLRAQNASEEESNLTDRLAYWWDLSPWRGQEVNLELTLRGGRERNEIAWRGLSVRSAIGNLPDSGQPLVPNVPLAMLTPLAGREEEQKAAAAIPRKSQDGPARLLGQEFKGSIDLARSSRVSYPLKPEFRTFVAVVGCTMQVAGPVQVLIDNRVVWERAAINSLTPAEQIEIAIPAGATTLTLRSGSEGLYYGTAAFAEAGFVE